MTDAPLRVSLAQQLEEIDLCLKSLNEIPEKKKDNAEWRLRMERLGAARRSISFMLEHKAEYLAMVNAKGDKDQLRAPPTPPPRTRTI